MSLRERCIEAAARVRWTEPGLADMPSYDDLAPEQRQRLHEHIAPGVDAVLAEVAAWCDEQCDGQGTERDSHAMRWSRVGMRMVAAECRGEGA